MVVTLIWHINYQHLSGLNVKLALAKRAYSVSRSRWKAEWISVEGKKLMWPRVAGGPSNKFAFHARSQERVASSWRRLTVNTSGHAWESVRRSHDRRRYKDRLLLQEVYPISRHSRAKPNEVAIKARGYYRANYGAGSIHLRTKSMANQSLTANGNEPVPQINFETSRTD